MYERMLNKQEVPTFDDLIRCSGASGDLWLALDEHMTTAYNAAKQIRFPYGKDYGWSAKYSVKSKHICDIFAENGACTALFQVSTKAMETVLDELGTYAKQVWADKSPCASGGWIEFRALDEAQMQDLKKIIHAKVTVRGK
ncbi:MAG: DUF3788 domain-containing protein [Oscillospiraceae bacterium]|nr:DUF3788 domain-containing protein [Oscillospiraceae bacterium]